MRNMARVRNVNKAFTGQEDSYFIERRNAPIPLSRTPIAAFLVTSGGPFSASSTAGVSRPAGASNFHRSR